MGTFVRTTGGLLQLKTKQVSKQDYDRIVQFALKLGDEHVRSRLTQQTKLNQGQQFKSPVQATVPSKKQPVDLQAVMPEVFR